MSSLRHTLALAILTGGRRRYSTRAPLTAVDVRFLAPYVQDQIGIGETIDILAGLRYDDVRQTTVTGTWSQGPVLAAFYMFITSTL